MNEFIHRSLHRFSVPCLAAIAAAVLMAPGVASATPTPYVVKLVQQDNNVVATASGALDSTDLRFAGYGGNGGVTPQIFPSYQGTTGIVTGGEAGGLNPIDIYLGAMKGPPGFGTGGYVFASAANGDIVDFGYSASSSLGVLFPPPGYKSDDALSSSATWDNATFASLGVTPGSYTWTWGSSPEQSFTLDIAVPEPAALGMFGLGLLLAGGFVALRRRDQRQAS